MDTAAFLEARKSWPPLNNAKIVSTIFWLELHPSTPYTCPACGAQICFHKKFPDEIYLGFCPDCDIAMGWQEDLNEDGKLWASTDEACAGAYAKLVTRIEEIAQDLAGYQIERQELAEKWRKWQEGEHRQMAAALGRVQQLVEDVKAQKCPHCGEPYSHLDLVEIGGGEKGFFARPCGHRVADGSTLAGAV